MKKIFLKGQVYIFFTSFFKFQLLIDKIGDRLAPSIDINISWTGSDQPPPRSTFRIHYLGIQGTYSFPVTIPVLLEKFSSSVSEMYSSFEGITIHLWPLYNYNYNGTSDK